MLTCPSVKYLHIDCPGCGMQRSAIALLKGQFLSSIDLYPALIPLMLLVVYTALHLISKFVNGAKIIVALQAIVTSIVIAHYIYKIIHHQIIH
jgi:hypothetical protein